MLGTILGQLPLHWHCLCERYLCAPVTLPSRPQVSISHIMSLSAGCWEQNLGPRVLGLRPAAQPYPALSVSHLLVS